MRQTDRFTFFFSHTEPFSQWYPVSFEVREPWPGATRRILVFQAEQYMMAAKAACFQDRTRYEQILETPDPRKAKALGRLVQSFDPVTWDRVAPACVQRGNVAKFKQNPELLRLLLATGSTLLVEASPYDRIWGIGLAQNDPRALDPRQWPGQNLLGKILTRVREHLREEIEAGRLADPRSKPPS